MSGPADIPAPVAAFAITALVVAVCYLMLVDRTRPIHQHHTKEER